MLYAPCSLHHPPPLAELNGIKSQQGFVSATVTPTGSVVVAPAAAVAGGGGNGDGNGGPRLQLARPAGTGSWALGEGEFGPGLVGGKSANLAALRSKLPAG